MNTDQKFDRVYDIPQEKYFGAGFKPKTGEVHGMLKVLHPYANDINGRGEATSQILYLCQCDCGVMVGVRGSTLSQTDIASCGCASASDARKLKRVIPYHVEETTPVLDTPAIKVDKVIEAARAFEETEHEPVHMCERIALMEELMLEMDKPHQKAAVAYLKKLATSKQ
jgi:hypothetical protein